MRALYVSGALMLLVGGSSSAQVPQSQGGDNFRAIDLLVACQPSNKTAPMQRHDAALICDAFTRGMGEGMFLMQAIQQKGERTCMPADRSVGRDEIIQHLAEWLTQKPQDDSGTAGVIATIALVRAYPCQ